MKKFTFTRRSPFSGKMNKMEIEMSQEQFDELQNPNRRNIQEIIPHCSADEREFIMTGITPTEWDETFGKEEKAPVVEEDPMDTLNRLSGIFTIGAVVNFKKGN